MTVALADDLGVDKEAIGGSVDICKAPPVPVRAALWGQYGIEIGGGLGDFAGKAWRVGLMGHAARRDNVVLLLAALESILKGQGVALRAGALDAAAAVYDG